MLLNRKRQTPPSTGSSDFKTETFLLKLFQILKNNKYTNCIHWSEDGNSIVISNITQLTKKILPKYFKHNNYASFVRQLNMYNFHKVRNCQKQKENEQIFQHEKFRREQNWEAILNIKRKIKYDINLDKKSSTPKDDVAKIQNYIENLKSKSVSKTSLENMIVFLLDKTKESLEIQNKLKKEVEELTKKNNFLMSQVSQPFNFRKLTEGVALMTQAILKTNLRDQNLFKQFIYGVVQKKHNEGIKSCSNSTNISASPTLPDNKIQTNESFSIACEQKNECCKENKLDILDCCPCVHPPYPSYINCDISQCIDVNFSKLFDMDFNIDNKECSNLFKN